MPTCYLEDFLLLLFVAVLDELLNEEDGVAGLHQIGQVILYLIVECISGKKKKNQNYHSCDCTCNILNTVFTSDVSVAAVVSLE